MIDIRAVCKVFLDFVYDNNVLPTTIEDILKNKEYRSQWDIRKVCEILAYKDNYQTNNGERFADMVHRGEKLYPDQKLTYNIYCTRYDWEKVDESSLIWLDKSQTLFNLIIDKLNEFFHNVDQDIGLETVFTAFCEIIDKSPNTFKKGTYLDKIEKIAPIQINKGKKLNEQKDNYAMAYNRISKWANRPNQINSTIIWSFFKAETIDGVGNATISLMKGLCLDKGISEEQFKRNYNQMTFDGPHSHGKVFEDDGNNVWIWEEIKPKLLQYKNAFYEE